MLGLIKCCTSSSQPVHVPDDGMLAVCNRVEGVPCVGVNLKYKCDAYEKLFRRYTKRYTRNVMERKLTEYLFGWLAQPCPRCGLRRRKGCEGNGDGREVFRSTPMCRLGLESSAET